MNIKILIQCYCKRLILLNVFIWAILLVIGYYEFPVLYNAILGPFELDDKTLQLALQDKELLATNPTAPFNTSKICTPFALEKFHNDKKFYFEIPNKYYSIRYPHYDGQMTLKETEIRKICQEFYSSEFGYILSIGTDQPYMAPQTNKGFIVGFDKSNIPYFLTGEGKILLLNADVNLPLNEERFMTIDNPKFEVLPIAFYNSRFYNILFLGSAYLYLVVISISVFWGIRNCVVVVKRLKNYTAHPVFKGIEDKDQFLRELQHAKVEKWKVITENWLLYDRFFYIKRYKRSRYFK